jgi:cysteine synthase
MVGQIGGSMRTPLWRLTSFAMPYAWVKMEGANWTGSMKIRSAEKIIFEARLAAGSTVVESTSGNMGVALAAVCWQSRLNCVLVVDPKLSPWHREAILQFGAKLVEVQEVDDTGGWLKTRLAKVHGLLAEHPDWFWANQYGNPNNALAFEEVGNEIVDQLSWLLLGAKTLWFFASVSTGGSLTGAARKLRMCLPSVRIKVVAVDALGSVIFGGSPQKRYLNGIGSSLANPPNLDRSQVDLIHIATDEEAFTECYRLRHKNFYVGGSSGAVFSAMKRLKGEYGADDIVVGLFPDNGNIYGQTIYSQEWLRERGFNIPKILEEACVG